MAEYARTSRTVDVEQIDAPLLSAIKSALHRRQTANVLGKWPGRDPKLAAQLVLITAHHDHLGRKVRQSGDDICNGAVDNAAGVRSRRCLLRSR